MDFKAVIDLVKYTLALSAACFVYTLEKFVPAPTLLAKCLALTLLALFLISAIWGILIFSSATAALHGNKRRAARQKNLIKKAAYIHIGFLTLGILLLGGKLVERVLMEVPAAPPGARLTVTVH